MNVYFKKFKKSLDSHNTVEDKFLYTKKPRDSDCHDTWNIDRSMIGSGLGVILLLQLQIPQHCSTKRTLRHGACRACFAATNHRWILRGVIRSCLMLVAVLLIMWSTVTLCRRYPPGWLFGIQPEFLFWCCRLVWFLITMKHIFRLADRHN
jgi:hypothetical protein